MNNSQQQQPVGWGEICILLPTYNNATTLADVIERSLKQTEHVLVVNDGSTDDSLSIINRYPVKLCSYEKNQGKGYALQQGFAFARTLGYRFAITIDTDGQHYPEDCMVFLDEVQKDPNVLLIGARNMNQANVPVKSNFGNKFSSFWFWVNTGIKLQDTQSGYRLYPIEQYDQTHFYTKKFEFEIEIIVRSAWSGIQVKHVPVRVFYPNPEERVSHFRPFKDFTRISILNTVLVLIAFFVIKPRDLLIRPIKDKGWKGLKEMLFNPKETVFIRSASIGFGLFMGIVPVWGFQLLIGIPLALFMRMNKVLFIVAANVSIFPPVIWAASLAVGKWIFGNPDWDLNFIHMRWDQIAQTGKEFIVGGSVLAVVAGILGFGITYVLLGGFKSSPQKGH